MHNSSLYDEKTFYSQFINDLLHCEKEVIIESPFITTIRIQMFYPVFEKLIQKGVKIYVVTRDPREHRESYKGQSEYTIQYFERVGIQPLLCTGNHHRKLAILDRKQLWEGSLNILSQTKSREIMRRIDSKKITMEMFDFLNFASVL
jgi:hypothetical protein